MPATVVDVEPRVVSPKTGDRIRLVDAVDNFFLSRTRGCIALIGASSETEEALMRVSEALQGRIQILHEPYADKVSSASNFGPVLFSAKQSVRWSDLLLHLAPWDDDDLVDYLLCRHPAACASVMKRIKSCRRIWRPMTRAGWREVLNGLAANPDLRGPEAVIENHLRSWLQNPDDFLIAYQWAEALFAGNADSASTLGWKLYELPQLAAAPVFFQELTFRRMTLLIGWTHSLRAQSIPANLRLDTSNELLLELAQRLIEEPQTVAFLKSAVSPPLHYQSSVASVLSRVDLGWRPAGNGWRNFNGSQLQGVAWNGVQFQGARNSLIEFGSANLERADLREARLTHVFLRGANLENADLSGAQASECTASGAVFSSVNLSDSRFHLFEAPQADFTSACLHRANFNIANLTGAKFQDARLTESILFKIAMNNANLRGADLRGARLEQVSLVEADLTQADFRDAYLELSHFDNCDFRSVELTGACFKTCWMRNCNLEAVQMPNALFQGSDLSNAWLTDSVMPGANFRDARLFGAGLGAVNWENADLRGAELRCATFHFGSTRSGIVDSPYPSHGTRTGFYTDDFYDYPGKSVEEIRSANLRGADLRGAEIGIVDFYLVDLRDAKIDLKHLPHLRRCRAILS